MGSFWVLHPRRARFSPLLRSIKDKKLLQLHPPFVHAPFPTCPILQQFVSQHQMPHSDNPQSSRNLIDRAQQRLLPELLFAHQSTKECGCVRKFVPGNGPLLHQAFRYSLADLLSPRDLLVPAAARNAVRILIGTGQPEWFSIGVQSARQVRARTVVEVARLFRSTVVGACFALCRDSRYAPPLCWELRVWRPLRKGNKRRPTDHERRRQKD